MKNLNNKNIQSFQQHPDLTFLNTIIPIPDKPSLNQRKTRLNWKCKKQYNFQTLSNTSLIMKNLNLSTRKNIINVLYKYINCLSFILSAIDVNNYIKSLSIPFNLNKVEVGRWK